MDDHAEQTQGQEPQEQSVGEDQHEPYDPESCTSSDSSSKSAGSGPASTVGSWEG